MEDHRLRMGAHYRASLPGFRDSWAPALGALTRPIIRRLDPACLGRVLDLGCGTGETSALLQEHLGRAAVSDNAGVSDHAAAGERPAGPPFLVGTDVLPEMLAETRRRLPGQPLVLADAARLPFADRSFDLVVSAFVFHHVREQHRALGEVFRVLRPGGRLLLITWGRELDAFPATETWEELLLAAGAPETDPEPLLSWRDAIDAPESLGRLVASAGFGRLDVRTEEIVYRWTPERLAGWKLGSGESLRRLRCLPADAAARFERRVRAALATLPPEAFDWRPSYLSATAVRLPQAGEARAGTMNRSDAGADDYRTICPNCGAVMHDRGCKTRCPRCHFFTDCSDPW